MVFTFALLLVIVAVLVGWGYGIVRVLRKVNVQSPYRFDPIEPVIGLALAGVLVNIENFVFRVNPAFAWAFVLIGLLLFLVGLPRFAPLFSKPLWVGLGLVWIGAISTEAVLQPWNSDSWLYHMPSIHWLIDSPVPFGLANLHGRLGFDSFWFSVSAMLAEAVDPWTSNYTALASEGFLAVFGLAALGGTYKLFQTNERNLANLFLVLTGVIGFSTVVTQNLSSPSTDHPVLLLSLLLVYVFLRAISVRDASAFRYEFWLAVLLASFAIAVKLSMLPLALIPIALVLYGWQKGFGILQGLNLLPALATSLVVLAPWILRNVILSGCVVYPISQTCFWGLPWAVPRAQAVSEALWIQSWARYPGLTPDQVLANWDWLSPWVARLIGTRDFVAALRFFVLGTVLVFLFRHKLKQLKELPQVGLLAVIVLIGLGYWFVTAPDLRFGVTWFWILGLSAFSVGLWGVATSRFQTLLLRLLVIGLLAYSTFGVANVGLSFIQRAGWSYSSALYIVPPLPKAKVVVKVTNQGVPVSVVEDTNCYWETGYCTPYWNPKLVIRQTPYQRVGFYLPH